MLEGIRPKEIKRALKENNRLAREIVGGYNREENEWDVYDSSIDDFGRTFLPGYNFSPDARESGSNFKIFIEKTLINNIEKHDLTAIEFGGPGSKLFSGFTFDFFKKTVGVCLKDIRSEAKKENDRKINHFVMTGDIMEVQNKWLLEQVMKKLDTDKTDLIISKMNGPLKHIDRNGAILDRLIRNWYDILNENGLMFIQFTYGTETENIEMKIQNKIEKWVEAIKERFPEVEIQVNTGTIRLHKKFGAPEHLPPATILFSKN
ncbi:MAG: hypothetical protein WAN61_02800 [Minisyncoccia bacterium]